MVKGDFANQDFNWNVIHEGRMSGLWRSPGSPEELGLTCDARASPQEKAWYLDWFCGLWQSFQERNEASFSERWLKKESKAHQKPQGLE